MRAWRRVRVTFLGFCSHANPFPVCHPGLRDNWFANLGKDAQAQARVLFEAVYATYVEANTEGTQPAAAPVPAAPAEQDFLDLVGAAPVVPEMAAAAVQSECTRWFSFDGGCGEMKKPLSWSTLR